MIFLELVAVIRDPTTPFPGVFVQTTIDNSIIGRENNNTRGWEGGVG
jgi:hypothetical protein